MIKLHEKFIVDEAGKRVGVFLDMKVYREILEILEEMEDIKAYDEAKKSNETPILFDEAVKEIETNRK